MIKLLKQLYNKLNEGITVKLENNKDKIIQSLKNEVSLLQNRDDDEGDDELFLWYG